jgi:hypothetical protein
VASLRAAPTTATAPNLDPKAPHMRAHRHEQILLVLVGLTLKLKLPAARWTRIRQRHPDLLIYMIRSLPVRVSAVISAAATTRPSRVGLRLTLGKRRGLTLPRAPQLLGLGPQPLHLCPQAVVLGPQPASPHAPTTIGMILPHTTHPMINTRTDARTPPIHTAATFVAEPPTPSRPISDPLTHYLSRWRLLSAKQAFETCYPSDARFSR